MENVLPKKLPPETRDVIRKIVRDHVDEEIQSRRRRIRLAVAGFGASIALVAVSSLFIKPQIIIGTTSDQEVPLTFAGRLAVRGLVWGLQTVHQGLVALREEVN